MMDDARPACGTRLIRTEPTIQPYDEQESHA